MARDLGELNREEYARYKDDVKKEGKPFFPLRDVARHGHVVRRRVRHRRRSRRSGTSTPTASEPGLLGPWYTEPADPGTTDFIPRPDWYFYFLFYLLRIFEWPETVFIATVGIPTICLILLLGLPFYDRRRERRPTHRPVAMVAAVLTILSMAVLTWKGATAKEALGSELVLLVPEWAEEQGFADDPQAVAGRRALRADRAASTATRTSGRARGTSARRTSPRSGRRTTPSTSSATSRTRPRSGTT